MCVSWLEKIKEKSSDNLRCCDLWVKWNRSLVSIFKHNKVVLYSDPSVDMIVWADEEKFARWVQFLPVPKIRLSRDRLGERGAVQPSTLPPMESSSSTVGHPTEGVPVFSCFSGIADAPDRPFDVDLLAPSLGADWSGFDDELAEPFPDLPPVEPFAPPLATFNVSQKRARSPDPPVLPVSSLPSSSLHPATGGGRSGFTADQVASLRLLIQSGLPPPAVPAPTAPPPPEAVIPSPTPPVPGPSQVQAAPFSGHSTEPQPGPSWEFDLPTQDNQEEVPPPPEFVDLSDTEDGDDVHPPVGRSRHDPIHLAAAEALDRMWHDIPPAVPPISIPGLRGHTEATIYYCGSNIHYKWYDGLRQLLLIEGNGYIALPVDQDFVRVFREGGHLAFSIAEPEESLHAIFRPFVLAALRTRPKTCRPERTTRDQLSTTAFLDVIRKRSSFTPMEASNDKWVEADRTLAKKLLATVEDARRNANLKVLACPLPIASAGTGFSQYFLGPSLSSSASSLELRDLLRTNIPRSLLADELRERSAVHHYWTVLHPLQLAHDMASVADSTVFTVKQEGVRSVPLPTLLRRIQDAVSLSFDHLEEMCARSLTKAIQAKVAIREFLLGALKPHTLCDPLLASDLIHPTIFAPGALGAVCPSLRRLWMGILFGTMRDAFLSLPTVGPSLDVKRRRAFVRARPCLPGSGHNRLRLLPSSRPCLRSRIGALSCRTYIRKWRI